MSFREAIQSASQTAKRMQPGDRALYKPACDSQATSVVCVAFGKDGSDTHPTQDGTKRLGVEAAIALDAFGKLPFGSRLAADGRHVDKYVERLGDLVDVGRRGGRVEGNALGIGQHMMLAAGFARSVGFGPVSSPPSGALAKEASMRARFQSIWSAPLSSAKSKACSLSQTPAWCQKRR